MPRTPRTPPISEAAVLKACLALLRARGVLAWRNNTGAVVGEHKGRKRFVRYGLKGSSDILGCLCDGRLIAVETKRKGKRPTPDQLAFLIAVNRAGGVGVWVDGVEQLDRVLSHVLSGGSVEVDEDGAVWITRKDI